MLEFTFRRTGKLLLPEAVTANTDFNFPLVASLDANLRKLGYALDSSAALALGRHTSKTIADVSNALIEEIKEIKGVRSYRPMYPNFPKQVMEASDAELYINAIMHYFGDAVGLRILPDYPEHKRPELVWDEKKIKFIGLATQKDVDEVIRSLAYQKAAWSEQDREDFFSPDVWNRFRKITEPEVKEFENRENKALYAAKVYDTYGVIVPMDTATDVLRFAVAISGGDVSLAEKTKFKNFRRPQRRAILNALNEVGPGIAEDMLRHEQTWKRLGERLHPGEFKQFPLAHNAFVLLRANSVKSFDSYVEKAFALGDIPLATATLKRRPGVFVRNLDRLLRNASNIEIPFILKALQEVGSKASTTVLMQAHASLQTERGVPRVFYPKGQVSKFRTVADNRNGIAPEVAAKAAGTIESVLVEKFKDRAPLGKVFVDSALNDIPVPFALRNASKGRVLGRGARLPFSTETNFLRFFIWWKNIRTDYWGGGRVDIDLSAALLDENFKYLGAVAYYNLRTGGAEAVHSGDITSAPNGASEFIDINIKALRERGARYVAMTVHNYTHQKFSEVPEVFAGYMEREDQNSGEIYDPRTVENRVDLAGNSINTVPFIFDLETGQAIWVDMSLNFNYGRGHGGNNAASTSHSTEDLLAGIVHRQMPSLYDLLSAHAQARGEQVYTREEADVVFDMDTAYKVETILDKYL